MSIHIAALLQLRGYYNRAPSTFAVASPDARRLAALGMAMTVVGTLIFLVVVAIIFYGLWRRRHVPSDASDASESDADGNRRPPIDISENRWVLGGGFIMPVIVLVGVFLLTLASMRASTRAPVGAPEIVVTGHQWWWEVRYPNDSIVTANELHLPVGRAVRVRLRSADVIHSFWAPNLNGKTDLIPGHENEMVLLADSAGVYRGQCAEYCGQQHGHMALSIIADAPAAYARWLASARAPAHPARDSIQAAGLEVFMTHACSTCHTIRGTLAVGMIGPDLTHIGSRLTLASGMLPNTIGNLGGWITNPDLLKPGTRMPPTPLDGPGLQAVIHYLESLK